METRRGWFDFVQCRTTNDRNLLVVDSNFRQTLKSKMARKVF